MANILKISACPNSLCKETVITELSGQYNSLNLGGYGSPNAAISDVATAQIGISKRGTDGSFPSDTNINVFPTLPSDSGGTFTVTETLYPDGFGDGIYRFTYKITGVQSSIPFTYSTVIYIPIICGVSCCWQKLSLKVCQCPTTDLMDKQRRVSVLMRALQASTWDCGSLDNAQTIIDELTSLCNQTGCGCGK